ncbi:hypothetical protein HCK00_00550 [Streptomyces sp. PLAI1-29]|uniref:Histidine kinase/HSP90-like ATPase domain-containing protein n=1 Tax=Streptomyces zingiberis TaxID=2053010 RepID=A0ABX1BTJ0_9ACTN|nr:hypothetical protein [Streptomyces zingiberis]
MAEWGHPPSTDVSCAVALVVGELAANAVRHGRVPGRDFRLQLRLDEAAGLVRIEVTDAAGARRLPATPPPPGPDGESGRGLLLVDSLAARRGSEPRHPTGKTVWAEVPTARTSSNAPGPAGPSPLPISHRTDGDPMDANTWTSIDKLRQWLDDQAGPSARQDRRLLRVLKIGEEFGEVAEAVHGALGANPRKGASHSWGDVEKELCDVIVTSMVALASITPEGEKALDDRLRHLVARAGL